ncbi:hypothetical protein AB0I16_27770 [Streptomyces sp. NPDC050703]|uniref:hypothetical protein n=1 Tax=Streptomyces sp. NPDC050703 TaxID=3157218 RepID=UPI003435B989
MTARRQEAVLGRLLDGLRSELADWRVLATRGDPPELEKHRSQLAAVEAMLTGGLAEARARLDAGERAGLPVLVLDLHHVWDYFRSKFTLRRMPEYRDVLATADELAWSCYEAPLTAALGVAGTPSKEPPLVSFGRAAGPRAHRRGDQYRDLLPRGGVHTREGVELARSLPFPVIDLPWYYGSHLPALLTVAHEAGHHIEDDFALTPAIGHRLASAALPAGELPRWHGWAGEVFADVCATLVCGAAYPAVLAEVLTTLTPEDATAAAPGAHPPAGVRLGVCAAVLSRVGADSGPAAGTAGRADLAEVARALVDGGYDQFGGRSLPELLCPRPRPDAEPEYAGTVEAEHLLSGMPSRHKRVPGVLAAAALAFLADPEAYDARAVGARATAEALALRAGGFRRTPAVTVHDAAAAGRRLLSVLREGAGTA